MLIGKDTRVSGDMLEAALIAGMTSAGIDVVKLGIIPTPGVSYLTGILNVDGGVMISASHNPIADNGIKFFNNDGYKLTDKMEDEIEELIFYHFDEIPAPTHNLIGMVDSSQELVNKYIDFLISTVEVDFSGLRIVLDCANGAAFRVAPRVFEALGAKLIVLNNSPDGEKINVNCGSTHPEIIRQIVLRENADIGIAHDGDADRVVVIADNGEILDGDKIMAICALDLIDQGNLRGNTLVTTAYSNLGLKEVINKAGGNIAITSNGDRYVLEEMLRNDFNFGGEKSGHIIFLDYNKTGDGVLTALRLVEIVKKRGKSLSELAGVMKPWPQRLANVRVIYKDRLGGNPFIQETIARVEERLGDKGRVFIRPSGTEPVIRIMLEGRDDRLLAELEEDLIAIIEKELN